jgi:hypothetical protein
VENAKAMKKARPVAQPRLMQQVQGHSRFDKRNTNGLFLYLAWQHRQQPIQPPHKTRRIVELATFGQQGLLEQQVGPVLEPVFVGLAVEPGKEVRVGSCNAIRQCKT